MQKMGIKVSITRKRSPGRSVKKKEKKIKSKESRKTTKVELRKHRNSQNRKTPKFSIEIENAHKETAKEGKEGARPKK